MYVTNGETFIRLNMDDWCQLEKGISLTKKGITLIPPNELKPVQEKKKSK